MCLQVAIHCIIFLRGKHKYPYYVEHNEGGRYFTVYRWRLESDDILNQTE